MSYKDLTGNRYGRLVVVSEAEYKKPYRMWNCVCDCGNTTVVRGTSLTSGHTTSCGCFQRDCASSANTKHGMYKHRLYRIYGHMVRRCCDEREAGYKNYGGRGIRVCDGWKNSFEKFAEWAYDNGYQDDLTIDRIDVNGNYEPSNCRWVTQKVQANNTRRNRMLEFNGETHTMGQWADILGLSYNLVDSRIFRGWDVERALTEPPHENMMR
ncbi:MAG: hypothetical protein LUD69_04705 [Oscillospiraceae bacterium]|nr:hypothetical protein [Oscillospiraceae bacterium]